MCKCDMQQLTIEHINDNIFEVMIIFEVQRSLRDDRCPKNGCFLETTLRFFPENPLSMRKFAMKFFGLKKHKFLIRRSSLR